MARKIEEIPNTFVVLRSIPRSISNLPSSQNQNELKDDLAKRIAQALKHQLEFERDLNEAIRNTERITRQEMRRRKEEDIKNTPLMMSEHELDELLKVRTRKDKTALQSKKDALRQIISNFEVKMVYINRCCTILLGENRTEESDSRDLLLSIHRVRFSFFLSFISSTFRLLLFAMKYCWI